MDENRITQESRLSKSIALKSEGACGDIPGKERGYVKKRKFGYIKRIEKQLLSSDACLMGDGDSRCCVNRNPFLVCATSDITKCLCCLS